MKVNSLLGGCAIAVVSPVSPHWGALWSCSCRSEYPQPVTEYGQKQQYPRPPGIVQREWGPPAYNLSCNSTLYIIRATMPSEAIRICCCCHFQQGGVHQKTKKTWQLNNSEWYPLNSVNKQFDMSGEALWQPRCCSWYLKLRYMKTPHGGNIVVADISTEIPPVAMG